MMEKCKLKEFIYAKRYSGEYIYPHKHDAYEVIYFMEGEGVASVGNEHFHYTNDTIQIIPPNCLHQDVSYITTKLRCCVFYCSEEISLPNATIAKDESNKKFFENILNQIRLLEQLMISRENPDTEGDYLDNAVGVAYSDGETDRAVDRELWFFIVNLLNIVGRAYHKPQLQNDFISEVKYYIETNFNRNINFEILAEKIGYSYDRLRHIFTEKTGSSLKKYQQSIRLAKAKSFLTETDFKVKLIAERCGFASDVRFSIFFRDGAGVAPLRYRAMMKNVVNQFM